MRKGLKIFIATFLLIIFTGSTEINANEVRAAWLTTAWSLDWPSNTNNIEKQKNEMVNILEQLKDTEINTVMFQVRPKADALYKSNLNPWSDVLTGTQGKNPGYDPLLFIIEEAHKRGIKVHAWLNPYRVMTSGTDLGKLSDNHPAKLNPSWVIEYNNGLYYNPELTEVKTHISDSVKEIVENYNVDGIVFDDYFYPENYPLPNGESKDGVIANLRRNHINDMIRMVSGTIKQVNPGISFGISPSGIWKNKSSDPTGSDTRGNESYYSVYADTRTWIKNGWIDYVSPQIYWNIGYEIADYSKLIEWWSNEVKDTNVDLYISHTLDKSSTANEIDKQLELNTKYSNIKGSVFYRTSHIMSNKEGSRDKIKNFYNLNNKFYYLDINSFLGEQDALEAMQRLKEDTGWYLEHQKMENKEPIYNIQTGAFAGEETAKLALKMLQDRTELNGDIKFTGEYNQTYEGPIYHIETGGFIGEETVKEALKYLQDNTGWWATYEQNGSNINEYKIVTGGFIGEESVKAALDTLKRVTGWWAKYEFSGQYEIIDNVPLYRIDIDGIIGEENTINQLEKLKNSTGWWAEYKLTNKYEYYYKIITGSFLGIENAQKQSEFVKNNYKWYNEIKEQ